jgi:D-alanyl-lipoteichoic acid acyltransferase DltB (MBOAT superfamily)
MEICSIKYVLACCGIVLVFQLLPVARLRRFFLGVVNALFLAPLVHNTQSWIWFVIFLGGTYVALVLVRFRPRPSLVWIAIAVAVGLFTYLKKYSFVPLIVPVELWWDAWGEPIVMVGLSYMLFKFIHMVVDEWQDQLEPFTFFSYLNYQLVFFTLVAGPIQRYNDFKRGWDQMDLQTVETRESWLAWNRILTGMIKMRVIAPVIALALPHGVAASSSPSNAWLMLLGFYAFPVQLYFNFSGYTDAAIGSARLLGFQLPENFNRPYLARNVIDFWDRWHMSLSHWVRDYVFMVSYKAAAMQFPRTARWWGYGLLFVTLYILGIWHGTASGFAVFGILNGIGAVVNRAYGDFLRSVLGRRGVERYLHSRVVQCLAILVTFHYVCFCHLAFASSEDTVTAVFFQAVRQVTELLRVIAARPEIVGVLATLVVVSLLVAGFWRSSVLERLTTSLSGWLARRTPGAHAVVYAQILVVTFFFFLDWTYRQEPPPVIYMKF